MRASPAYPLGPIKFNPAKEGGLLPTFQHQSYNGPGSNDEAWRTGSLCLDTPARSLGRHAFDIEPYEPEKRLRWHARRACRWLEAASRGELALPGEPFELPQFPVDQTSLLSVMFSESPESFSVWQKTPERVGIVELYDFQAKWNVQVVKSFQTLDGRKILMPAWGPSVTGNSKSLSRGFWFRLRETPALDPWQAPVTWGEMRQVCRGQGVGLDELLQQAAGALKSKGKIGRMALAGFPLPVRIGEAPERMHWLSIKLPEMVASDVQARGFRRGSKWNWQYNRQMVMRDDAALKWGNSENWYPDQLQTRGVLPVAVTSKMPLFLGAGALGSALSELLVRAGFLRMLIVDEDRLEAGNLVRHTLDLTDLNEFKATGVAKRLNNVSPLARIEALNASFPPKAISDIARVEKCDLVIDCTGDDEVLYHLATVDWKGEILFYSASMSLGARRLYCFTAKGTRFPNEVFRRLVSPWLARDAEDHIRSELPREGIGCWHPVFPARTDDVWMLATMAVKHLEQTVSSPPAKPELVVFGQTFDEEGDVFWHP